MRGAAWGHMACEREVRVGVAVVAVKCQSVRPFMHLPGRLQSR